MAEQASATGQEARRHLIDPSAWISGLAFATGILLAGPDRMMAALRAADLALGLIAASYGAFLLSVLVIQRHMRKSMLASTFGSPQQLTTGGIFRYSRNPIYVAFMLPLASIAALSPVASLAAAFLYVILMNRFVIAKEEQELASIFGQAYADYRVVTPRWLSLRHAWQSAAPVTSAS